MNVIYATDNTFVPILAVSIKSLCKYNYNINIAILDNGISVENKKIIRSCINDTCNLDFLQISKKKELEQLSLNYDRGTYAQYGRLFIQDILPREWKKVLYLDCDTLIRKSLKELFNYSTEDKVIYGIEDAFSKLHRKCLGLDENDIYINSGVMLINLEQWKLNKIEKKFIEYIVQKHGGVLQGDQGIINAVLKNKIGKLPVKWNLVTYNFDFSYDEMCLYRKPTRYYSMTEITEAKKNPIIIHFTTSFISMRPWENRESKHPYCKEWIDYYEELDYEIKNRRKKVLIQIYNHIPHNFFLYLCGIAHAYLKPMKWMGLNILKNMRESWKK